jgi:hypothetical protein
LHQLINVTNKKSVKKSVEAALLKEKEGNLNANIDMKENHEKAIMV